MTFCGVCGRVVASAVCRRCGLEVCANCVAGHGLCKKCRQALRRSKGK